MSKMMRLVLIGLVLLVTLSFLGAVNAIAAPEICDGLDNDNNGLVDDGVRGYFFSAFQQPTQQFGVGPVMGTMSAVDYYNGGNPSDPIAVDDGVAFYVYEDSQHDFYFGILLDKPQSSTGGEVRFNMIWPDGGSIVGGTAVNMDAPVGDIYGWRWQPGEMAGLLYNLGSGRPLCIVLAPLYIGGVDRIVFWNGSSSQNVTFDSVGNPITVCSNLCGPPPVEVCDGVDNDLDGQIDEGITPTPSSCGDGECATTGEVICQNGTLVDTCSPPPPSNEICDGLDNNCNGIIDEGIAAIPMTCGVGACQATGQKSCKGGQMVDSCVLGAQGIESCDGIDNNCNGEIDEGVEPVPTTCGIGACRAIGQKTCQGGQMVDSCVPFAASAQEVCDKIDNDCDSLIDEGIDAVRMTCGVGACQASGWRICQGGEVVETCLPLSPTEEKCDTVDNDCDGQVDEEDVCSGSPAPSVEPPAGDGSGTPSGAATEPVKQVQGSGTFRGCSLIK